MLRMTQIRNYLMMIVYKDAAGNASCSGVWFSMSGKQLLVTIVIHSFTMGKRKTSYSVGICRNRHSICVPKGKKCNLF